jgi:hypothetical protein
MKVGGNPAARNCRRNNREFLLSAGLWGAAALFFCALLAGPIVAGDPADGKTRAVKAAAALEEQYRGDIVPFLKKHCIDCHSGDEPEGDVAFDDFQNASAVAADQKTWARVIEMLRSGAMPPADGEQPMAQDRERVVHWIEKTIYNVDCEGPVDPGRVTIRRLNRAEYNNTVRDLLGVTFQPANDFPSDDVGGGFDNLGEVLTLPPLLMEKYLAAAERIAEESIVADTTQFVKSERRDRRRLRGEGSAEYNDERDRWEIASEDGIVSAEFNLPRAGEYKIRAYASATQAGDEAAQMELRIGDKKLKTFDINTGRGSRTYELQTKLEPGGEQRLSAHFLNDFYDPENPDERRRDRNLRIYAFEIDGPLDLRSEDFPEVHRTLAATTPSDTVSVGDAARANLRPFMNRAFRRPATDDEVNRFAGLVEAGVKEGDTFEQGMQVAVTAVLVSPHFLFRIEQGGPLLGGPHAPRADDDQPSADSRPLSVRDLTDFELATRMSYFLWSSMPDDELFALAAEGKLRDQAIREQQVRRMLADPKSEALVQNFAAQWLNLRLLDGTTPDPNVYPQFSADLKADMRRETQLFVGAIIREDRSVLDFLGGRFTFVNERLAKHYGLEGVSGDEFRRVEFRPEDQRSGVLTQASILTLTSNPGRTSPVKRGKWILENILGSPPPDPPANVPDLDETGKAQPGISLRKQLEIHRQNAVCASCHKTMDQLGFGLENFDAIGRWRTQDGEHAVDSTGQLPGAEKFSGPVELAEVLQKRRLEFTRCLSEKMLTFALGRELHVPDRCAVDTIVKSVESHDFRFSALVTAIVNSDPFRKRRADGGTP